MRHYGVSSIQLYMPKRLVRDKCDNYLPAFSPLSLAGGMGQSSGRMSGTSTTRHLPEAALVAPSLLFSV